MDQSNIILKVTSVVGKAQVRVFIMEKDKFEYPKQIYNVILGTSQSNFNISGAYFEYYVYVLPDTFSAGSYHMDIELEQAYQPKQIIENDDKDEDNKTSNQTDKDQGKGGTAEGGNSTEQGSNG